MQGLEWEAIHQGLPRAHFAAAVALSWEDLVAVGQLVCGPCHWSLIHLPTYGESAPGECVPSVFALWVSVHWLALLLPLLGQQLHAEVEALLVASALVHTDCHQEQMLAPPAHLGEAHKVPCHAARAQALAFPNVVRESGHGASSFSSVTGLL